MENKSLNKSFIRCPHCGREYHPAEIYYPEEFFGHPVDIRKDENGVILSFSGKDMNLVETYTCDGCGNMFSVEATVSFKAEPYQDLFSDDPDFEDLK